LIYALSDEYHALCGFRPVREAKAAIESLGDDDLVDDFLRRLGSDDSLPGVFEWLSSRAEGVAELVERVVALAAGRPEPEFSTVGVLAREYPGDPAIVISLLVNHVVLRKGQVLYLPAGNIHAYLEGVGIELMSSSDNVLRGGITPKHVDVEELLRVLDFATGLIPLLAPTEPMPGLRIFRPDVPDFALAVIELDRSSGVGLDPRGPAVALCVAGGFALAGRAGSAAIAKGEALYVSGDEGELRIEGSGLLFVAMGNPPAK
jgi:mannose-6-phosphate isomerase